MIDTSILLSSIERAQANLESVVENLSDTSLGDRVCALGDVRAELLIAFGSLITAHREAERLTVPPEPLSERIDRTGSRKPSKRARHGA